MKKIYIAIMIIVICVLIALIYRLDNKHNKLNSYNLVVNDPILNEKQWNEKEINEQFTELEYNNYIYLSTDMKINVDDIKKEIDTTDIIGSEDSETIHEKQVELYSIKDMSVNYAVAVKFEDDENYYMYARYAYKDDLNKDTTIYRYDKNTNTTIPAENSTINEDRQKIENNDLNDKTEQFKNIFYKYYGKEYSEKLFSDIQRELYDNMGEYEVPESSMIMLEKAIQLLENKETSESERGIIKDILNAIDTSYIDDINVLNSLENLGIELDN